MTETTRVRSFIVNGDERTVEVEDRTTLADALRESLRLTGTHLGCEHGPCGACTVLLDGEPARACLVLAAQAEGSQVRTVEGLAPAGTLGAVAQAMRDVVAFQCAFCAPGFLVTITHLLAENPRPDRQEVRIALSGNLCRCTGYEPIIDGVLLAADRLAADVKDSHRG